MLWMELNTVLYINKTEQLWISTASALQQLRDHLLHFCNVYFIDIKFQQNEKDRINAFE